MNRTVFVTGGAGFVGSHCCKAFADAGWHVVVYDNLSRGWKDFVKWGPLVEGDILDRAALTRAIREARPDAVAHFAALSSVGEAVAKPNIYYETNVAGTLNLLNAMLSVGVLPLVFSSTCAIYGETRQMPITEDCPQRPVNPYGWSKLLAERMMVDYGKAYGLRTVSLRYFNAGGAQPGGGIGERHEFETRIVPLAIRALSSENCNELTVFGDDFATPDGTCVRDYVHVCDVALAHVQALDYLLEGGETCAINIGTGLGRSVRDVISMVEKLSRLPVRHHVGSRREGDPAILVADPSRAHEVLAWRAEHSQLETIIADALAWHMADNRRHMSKLEC